jgi:DGQHR domain-containing protein
MNSVEFPCLQVKQPIGEFYIASIDYRILKGFVYADVRRIIEHEQRDFLTYLGIQRPLNAKRVKEISEYVKAPDSSFPTAIIIAVDEMCAEFNSQTNMMTIKEYQDIDEPKQSIAFEKIGKILDGQHRIFGLEAGLEGGSFQLNVSIFVGLDIAEQAQIFSTINVSQTKVSKSLVYDLYNYSKKRSPQKTGHLIAVALDQNETSPFYRRVKRLGVATPGRQGETLTQAAFVESIIKYISGDNDSAMKDRDDIKRGVKLKLANLEESRRLIFRNSFIRNEDLKIAQILWNYFEAISKRWNKTWNSRDEGNVLSRTNGFKGFMRFLKVAYNSFDKPDYIPSVDEFYAIFKQVEIEGDFFNKRNFLPGAGGQGEMFRRLCLETGLPDL